MFFFHHKFQKRQEKIETNSPLSPRILAELIKFRISLAVSLSGLAGYILFQGRIEWAAAPCVLGVFLLAAGASALNQVQERRIDGLMERTRRRPIPSGRLSPLAGLAIALALSAAGALTLWIGVHTGALVLGLAALFWYNGAYVFLKRKTAFAVIPGAWVGALPPLIGWVAAGGAPLDPRILTVALFVGVWQVPHFWLLALLYGEDYERSGLPSLRRICTPRQLALLATIWILATSLSGAVVALAGPARSRPLVLIGLSVALGLWLLARSARLLQRPEDAKLQRRVFHDVNSYVLALLGALCVIRVLA